MPVSRVVRDERPGQRVPRQALLDVSVLRDVNVVVIVDKGMSPNRIVQADAKDNQEQRESIRTRTGGQRRASRA